MKLDLTDYTDHPDGSPGTHMHAEIQQMGDNKTATDTTEIIVDTTPEHRDIRITDGQTILKIRLNEDYTIEDILENDRFLTAEQPER